jgi:hypothetical protein
MTVPRSGAASWSMGVRARIPDGTGGRMAERGNTPSRAARWAGAPGSTTRSAVCLHRSSVRPVVCLDGSTAPGRLLVRWRRTSRGVSSAGAAAAGRRNNGRCDPGAWVPTEAARAAITPASSAGAEVRPRTALRASTSAGWRRIVCEYAQDLSKSRVCASPAAGWRWIVWACAQGLPSSGVGVGASMGRRRRGAAPAGLGTSSARRSDRVNVLAESGAERATTRRSSGSRLKPSVVAGCRSGTGPTPSRNPPVVSASAPPITRAGCGVCSARERRAPTFSATARRRSRGSPGCGTGARCGETKRATGAGAGPTPERSDMDGVPPGPRTPSTRAHRLNSASDTVKRAAAR